AADIVGQRSAARQSRNGRREEGGCGALLVRPTTGQNTERARRLCERDVKHVVRLSARLGGVRALHFGSARYSAVTAHVPRLWNAPAATDEICATQPRRLALGVLPPPGSWTTSLALMLTPSYTHRWPGAACGTSTVPGHCAVGWPF